MTKHSKTRLEEQNSGNLRMTPLEANLRVDRLMNEGKMPTPEEVLAAGEAAMKPLEGMSDEEFEQQMNSKVGSFNTSE